MTDRVRTFLHSERFINILVFVLIYWFLLSYFNPRLLLSDTTATGGDMGSHNYIAYYLKNYLLSGGDMLGWTHDWYAGMPLLQFYFPLPYILMVALSYLISLQISFKLITVLGIFLLPLAAYFSMRWIGFGFPTPILSAIFTLPFLFTEHYSRWGGNIKSTLAGQFAHSLSISLALLLFGLLYLGVKVRKYPVLNSILVASVALSHIFTVTIALSSSLFFVILKRKKELFKNLEYLSIVFSLGFLLTAFWALPMFDKIEYTSPIGWAASETLKFLFLGYEGELISLVPFYILAIVGFYYGVRERDNRVMYLLFSTLMSILLFLFVPSGSLRVVRFLVFTYLLLMLAAGYGISRILQRIKPMKMIPFAVFFIVVPVINHPIDDFNSLADVNRWTDWNQRAPVQSWINWNYEGFENKNSWSTFSEINNFLDELPPGRVLAEYSQGYNVFGSERAFENIPLFAHKPVLKGLLMDSALSTYFVFYMWSEISANPACPIDEAGCSDFNIDRGTKHLEMFNVRYVLALSDKLRTALTQDSRYSLLEEFYDPYGKLTIDVFELMNNHGYVVPTEFKPVLIKTDVWRKTSLNWFQKGDLDVPLVFVESVDKVDEEYFDLRAGETVDDIPRIPINQSCSITEAIHKDEVIINTTCINRPLLVKVTYFPNWKVEGAKKIYLASPCFMLIFPAQENVRIYYGQTLSNQLGLLLTSFAIMIILYYLLLKIEIFRFKVHARMVNLEQRAIISLRNNKLVIFVSAHRTVIIYSILTLAITFLLFHNYGGIYDYGKHLCNIGFGNLKLVDSLDVGNETDERIHQYTVGVETAVATHTFTYPNGTSLSDNGRGYKGYEEFEIDSVLGEELLIVKRVDYGVPNQRVDIYADNKYVGTLRLSGLDTMNRWRDARFTVPGRYIKGDRTLLQFRYSSGSPDVNSFYYWFYVY